MDAAEIKEKQNTSKYKRFTLTGGTRWSKKEKVKIKEKDRRIYGKT